VTRRAWPRLIEAGKIAESSYGSGTDPAEPGAERPSASWTAGTGERFAIRSAGS